MSLSDLASIGSFASGVAVIVTLVFLLLQMRQANRNQRSLMQQGRSDRTVDILMRMTDPTLSETIMGAFTADAAPEPARLFAFHMYAAALFWNYEDSFLQFRAKTLDDASWATDVSTLRGLMTQPAYRASWRLMREGMGEQYRNFVDALTHEVRSTQPRSLSDLWIKYKVEETVAT